MILRPQPGAQEAFLSSPADIVIYGGAAGGGKSYGLLLEPLRHVLTNPNFNVVFFRRTTTQVRNPGGLWDESTKLYSAIPGAQALQVPLEWKFAGGGKVKFAHLEHEHTVSDWQGSQIPLICFDELTHFTASQFWYLLSRNRSVSGVSGYVRATCNPDADSWVAKLIEWWIDQNTGYFIPERVGVMRYFVRVNDTLLWADHPDDLPVQRAPDGQVVKPKSLTFIPAKLTDNSALMKADPGYYANLMALPLVERERLLGGNWKIKPAAGLYFQRSWVQVLDEIPARFSIECRGWDLAMTPDTGSNDPDWTSGVRIGRTLDGEYVVVDCNWLRGTPMQVQRLIQNTASQDGKRVHISLPQDPAAGGKYAADDLVRRLAGYLVEATPESRNPGGKDSITPSRQSAKVTRFGPFAAQAEAGNVKFLRGDWNDRLFSELEAFPEATHDDSADAISRAFAKVALARGRMMISAQALAR